MINNFINDDLRKFAQYEFLNLNELDIIINQSSNDIKRSIDFVSLKISDCFEFKAFKFYDSKKDELAFIALVVTKEKSENIEIAYKFQSNQYREFEQLLNFINDFVISQINLSLILF